MKFKLTKIGSIALGAAGLGLATINTTYAQESSENSNVLQLEEVVVTATRRATSLATTPLAISAVTGEMLERADVTSMADLAGEVTGLNIVDQGAGLHRPVIRGLQGVGDAQVGIYLDNTPLTGSPGTANSAGRFSPEIAPIDMERVEVLRGPQGTLYGGGAMGGAIKYIANKPDASQLEGQFGLGINSIDGNLGYDAHLVLNVPVVEDKFAIRAVGYKNDEDGYIDNVATGLEDINDSEREGIRLAAGWKPTDNLNLIATYIKEEGDAGARAIVQTDLDDLQTRNPGATDTIQDDVEIFNLTVNYETDWADLVYSYSSFERDLFYRYSIVVDLIGINPPNFGGSLLIQPQDVSTDVHEIRLVSNTDSNLQWTVGGFSSERDTFGLSDLINLDMAGNLIFPDAIGSPGAIENDIASLSFRRSVDQTQEEKAIFGEVSYDFNDRTTLTAGARFFEFDNRDGGQPLVLFGAPRNLPYREATSSHDGDVFKLKLSHEVLDDSVVYASWSQGFRAGGSNLELAVSGFDPLDTPLSFEPDLADNYELGFRGALNDGRMTVAAAAFKIDWTDLFVNLERNDLGPNRDQNIEFRANAGAAEITGFELEIESLVTENLTLSGGLTVVSGELDSDIQTFGDSRGSLAGDDLPFIPDYTFNLTAEYTWNLKSGLEAYAWGGYRYTGTTYGDFSPFVIGADGQPTTTPNIAYTEYGDYGVLNLKFGVEADDWSAALSIGNVLDERECAYLRRDTIRPDPGNCFIEKPRSVGLQFTKDF